MPESASDFILVVPIVLILLGLVVVGLRRSTAPRISQWSIGLGLTLLVLAAAFAAVRHYMPTLPDVPTWLVPSVTIAGFSGVTLGLLPLFGRLVTMRRDHQLQTALAKASLELQTTQGVLQSLMKSSLSGMFLFHAVRDADNEVTDFVCKLVNETGEQFVGLPRASILRQTVREMMPCVLKTEVFDKAIGLVKSGLPFSWEGQFTTANSERWYSIVAVRHGDGVAATVTDISDRKRIEANLRRAALHDTLTDLPNRTMFARRLQQAIHRAQHDEDYQFAVMFLDFDRFKNINDTLGHEIGDQLLISIAERIRANLRAIDSTVRHENSHLPARLGGDEFVILLDDIKEPQNAVIVAERLLKDLSQPHRIAGHEIVSTASIGIANSDSQRYGIADDILRDADAAMYRAKTSGKARHVVFNDSMKQDHAESLNLEVQLREAAEREAFILEYQPIVSLQTGGITGFESLIRWLHPKRGLIAPDDFVDSAEEFGLMVPIGRWVLREACRALVFLRDRHPEMTGLTMNVNLSKVELLHEDLVTVVERTLTETGVDPSSLRLEITESLCMNCFDEIVPIMRRLRGIGVQLAMDDFGKGHSSLSCLDQFPFDVLKIDQSFVRTERKTRDLAAFMHAMVALAHNLNMPVVVEGIETADQLGMLQTLDCDYGQGWLFSEAVSLEQADRLLARDAERRTAA